MIHVKLTTVSGLTPDDPLYTHLSILDRICSNIDWSEINHHCSPEQLIAIVGKSVGVKNCFKILENEFLENHEPDFAFIVRQLAEYQSTQAMNNYNLFNRSIYLIILWLIANIETLQDVYAQEGKKYRQITSSWSPSKNYDTNT